MEQFGREAQGVFCSVDSIARPVSNFSCIDEKFPSSPLLGPIRRIFSQVRNHDAMTVVTEELSSTDALDLSQEKEDLEKRYGAPVRSRVRRLSFFAESFSDENGLEALGDDCFIGYAIIKEDESAGQCSRPRIYESVLRPSRRPNNFIRGEQNWRCRVGSRFFETRGYLYAQQNGVTNVCAHVACRTAAARFHPDGDMTYREMNDLLGIDHVTRRIGGDVGISFDEMQAILESAGASCISGAYPLPVQDIDSPPYQRLVYGSVESGYPAVLCFAVPERGLLHAIPVFGHTFNEDMWVPHAELSYFRVTEKTRYIPSDWWLSSFVSHDDNCGSNFCIPRHFLHTVRQCDEWPEGPQECVKQTASVARVFATLPKEVEVGPIKAEVIGVDYLSSMLRQLPDASGPWKKRLVEYAEHHRLVLRPLLVQGPEYIKHLERIVDWDSKPIRRKCIDELRDWPLLSKGFAWMIELSIPELFAGNRRKLGEVLIRADRKPRQQRDFKSYLLARVPGFFAIHIGAADEPKYGFIDSGVQGHVPLFGCENDDPGSQ